MPTYDPETGLYSSPLPSIKIPEGLSLFDFVFHHKAGDCPGATERPDASNATWLIDAPTGKTYTRDAALKRTEDIARAFHSLGVTDKDAVAIFSSNEIDYACSIWGAHRLGAVVSCANPSYRASELTYQLDIVSGHFPAKVLLVHPDGLLEAVEAVDKSKLQTTSIILIRPADASTSPKAADLAKNYRTLDDVIAELQTMDLPPPYKISKAEAKTRTALLMFSSGTTGLPKAVQIAHYNAISNVLQAARHWQKELPFTPYDSATRKGDVIMGTLPFFHIYGNIVNLHLSVFLGTPVAVLRKFTFDGFLEAIQRYRVSVLYVVPPMVVLLVKNDTSKYDLSSVRAGMTGAAPLTEETAAGLKRKFPSWVFGQGYGMTETCTIVSLFNLRSPGASAGVLVSNVDAKVISTSGKAVGPGEVGELWTRSPSNALGYLGNQKATEETFDSEGFVHTGDEVKFDTEGNLYIVDRIKELIKVSGNQVAPAELEGHLLEHPLVQNCCVIGIYDERAGEKPKAYVALVPAAKEKLAKDPSLAQEFEESIKKHVADVKIHYKRLVAVSFIDVIPINPSGKLLRKELRALHAATEKSKNKL